jgi:hypothetical protein
MEQRFDKLEAWFETAPSRVFGLLEKDEDSNGFSVYTRIHERFCESAEFECRPVERRDRRIIGPSSRVYALCGRTSGRAEARPSGVRERPHPDCEPGAVSLRLGTAPEPMAHSISTGYRSSLVRI